MPHRRNIPLLSSDTDSSPQGSDQSQERRVTCEKPFRLSPDQVAALDPSGDVLHRLGIDRLEVRDVMYSRNGCEGAFSFVFKLRARFISGDGHRTAELAATVFPPRVGERGERVEHRVTVFDLDRLELLRNNDLRGDLYAPLLYAVIDAYTAHNAAL